MTPVTDCIRRVMELGHLGWSTEVMTREEINAALTALPKVCEALKECCVFLNAMKAYGDTRAEDLLSRLNSLFDDADGG